MSNSLELNKVFAAILTAGITFGVAGVIGRLIVHPTTPKESAIQVGEPAPAQAVAAVAAPAAPAAPQIDMAQLKQLGDLHAAGVLTDEEFAAAKAKLLAGG